MFSIWTLALITGIYLLILFIVATLGSRMGKVPRSVYALALGIHCTSWAFFGTTTQAVSFGWAFVPTYLGVIMVMFFGYSSLQKIAHICRQYKITSLAEFIGIRYQHSNLLSALIVLLCFVGVIPYIALQLDAISTSVKLMTTDNSSWSGSLSFYVTALMAIFAIFFGTRSLDLTTKRDGLMLTIAFQSLIKLTALCAVGIYCVYGLHEGWWDLIEKALTNDASRASLSQDWAPYVYISHIVLGICSMFCLPRQFHINFVENNNDQELARARWLFPLYLCLMTLFILPIALSGQRLFSDSTVRADAFVLSIPIEQGHYLLSLTAYIGGLAASTSMVIVASLALGNMVASSLLTPLLFSLKAGKRVQSTKQGFVASGLSARQLMRIRQLSILTLMLVAYWYHINVSQSAPLVKSGTIAIALMAQTLPAVIFALYWPNSRRWPIVAGLVLGAGIVVTLMLYPALLASYYFAPSPNDREFADAIFLSLSANAMLAYLGSLALNRFDKPQQSTNINRRSELSSGFNYESGPYEAKGFGQFPSSASVEFDKLNQIISRILPEKTAQAFFDGTTSHKSQMEGLAPANLVLKAERLLTSHLGNAGARILLRAIATNDDNRAEDLSELMEQASQSFQFNHEVLQSSIAHLPQGISVVDSDLTLVAWNHQYEKLFQYPEGFLKHGKSVREILQFNLNRGLLSEAQHEHQQRLESGEQNIALLDPVERRLALMQERKAYQIIRKHSEDTTIEISGNPLPGGGYITAFTDITQYIQIQQELEASKAELEQRVFTRTQELEQAKIEAEKANQSKSKFLAATGHDLMQPFNAAALFASILNEKLTQSSLKEVSEQLLQSLESADELLGMLIEMSKLETGKIVPRASHFALDDLLTLLVNEFSVIAKQKNIEIRYVKTSIWLFTDKRLLSRIVQNLLANAIRYTDQGTVLVGVRRRYNQQCELTVVDTGRGIAKDDQALIFDEFKRLEKSDSIGLGLGLTIVERTSKLLGIRIALNSQLGRGTRFGLLIPIAPNKTDSTTIGSSGLANTLGASARPKHFLADKQVLILENDEHVCAALTRLFTDWGATVSSADCQANLSTGPSKIDLILADYHLNHGENGVDLAKALSASLEPKPLMILSSADKSEQIQERALETNMRYLPKPIKVAALKRLIQSKLNV